MISRPSGARLGQAALWADVESPGGLVTIDNIVTVLGRTAADTLVVPEPPGAKPSAVIMLLIDDPTGPTVLLTRRSWELRSHRGEVCFPGGRRDESDDSLLETALRETEEEIGLNRSHIEVIGELDPLPTISTLAIIKPYVGVIRELPELTIATDEVDGIIRLPLVDLLDPAIFREEIWSRNGFELPVTFFELEGDTLWGLTARILRNLFELLIGVVPTGRDYA